MEQNTNSKPKPRKVRGTGTYVGDEFTFTPYEQGEPAQRNVKTTKGGKVYDTSSEKKPLKPQQQPDNRRVVAEEGLQCWLDESTNKVTFTGTIDLGKHSRDWQAEVLRQVQLVVRRLPASERFNKVINNIKKGTK